jgi:GNAT superfamily N-acetyltransferase
MDELARLRGLLGESTVLWAGAGNLSTHPGGWLALSGGSSVDYNIALCHQSGQGQNLQSMFDELLARRLPVILMVAGAALGDVRVLSDAGWICIGATPLMEIDLTTIAHDPDPGVRTLALEELPLARALIQDAFGIPPELALIALPDTATRVAGQAVWGLYDDGELVSCAAFVRVQEAIVGWSVATPERFRRRGYAGRLLRTVMAHSAEQGATRSLVYASAMGELLYTQLGFRELEHWQMWSRPRWVLARV